MGNGINFKMMKIKMFISSYCPLYIILLILSYEDFSSMTKLKTLVKFEDRLMSSYILLLIILILASLWTVIDLKTTKGNENIVFKDFEKMEEAMMVYFMTYVVPLLADDFLEVETIIKNASLFLLIGFMYVRSNLIYLNPLWLLFGYSVYKSNNNFIIISNLSYDELNSRDNKSFKATMIVSRVYVVQRQDQTM